MLKGSAGGFALAKPAEQINLLEVAEAIDGNNFFDRCKLGIPDCSPESPCSIREQWRELRSGLEQGPADKGAVEVAQDMKRLDYRKWVL